MFSPNELDALLHNSAKLLIGVGIVLGLALAGLGWLAWWLWNLV